MHICFFFLFNNRITRYIVVLSKLKSDWSLLNDECTMHLLFTSTTYDSTVYDLFKVYYRYLKESGTAGNPRRIQNARESWLDTYPETFAYLRQFFFSFDFISASTDPCFFKYL